MFVDEDDANLLPLCVHIVNGMHWIGERERDGGWVINYSQRYKYNDAMNERIIIAVGCCVPPKIPNWGYL